MKKRLLALATAVVLCVSMLVGCGAANSTETEGGNPGSETVKIVCGYGVGGTADLVARKFAMVANRLHPEYNFIVENMTGGDGFAAATYFAEQEVGTKDMLVYQYGMCYRHDLGKAYGTEVVDFDRKAMQPIGTIDDRTWILYTTPDKSLADILEKAKTTGLKMSGGNPLSDCHLALGSLLAMEGGKVMVVPYDGGASQKKALTDGEVDVFVGTTQVGAEEVEAGVMVPVLAFSDHAFEGFKDASGPITVPSVVGDAMAADLTKSNDYSQCILPAGGALAVRAGTDQAWIDAMSQVMKDVWEDPEYNGWIADNLLNRFEVYDEEAVKFFDDACSKAVATFDLLK